MPVLDIDGFKFSFPVGWQASKYDDWSFYRNQFAKQHDSIKAVDALAVSPGKCVFLIEVKDYRHPDSVKPSHLADAIAGKVLCTLAAMLPAKLRANEPDERQLAAAVLACTSLKVIVHIELPRKHQSPLVLADVKQELSRLLRAVDPSVKIVCMENMRGMAWTVTD